MSKRKRPALKPRSPKLRERMALQPIIDNIQDSLDRFQVMYEEGGDLMTAVIDLTANVEDLQDAVEKAEEIEAGGSR